MILDTLKNKKKWTFSDPDKRPMDMNSVELAMTCDYPIRGSNGDPATLRTYEDLTKIVKTVPNYAYKLNAMEDNVVIIDIEPKCPMDIKKKFMNLPYLYAETSMSGKGIHLVMALPNNFYAIPQSMKSVMKHKDGYYEVLISHWVTFTNNVIDPLPNEHSTLDWDTTYQTIANEHPEPVSYDHTGIEIDVDDIPNIENILTILHESILRDPSAQTCLGIDDLSRQEYALALVVYGHIRQNNIILNLDINDVDLCASIAAKIVSQLVEPRPKHDEYRNGMPWLVYSATMAIAKKIKEGE